MLEEVTTPPEGFKGGDWLIQGFFNRVAFRMIDLNNGEYISKEYISPTFCQAKEDFVTTSYFDEESKKYVHKVFFNIKNPMSHPDQVGRNNTIVLQELDFENGVKNEVFSLNMADFDQI